MGRVVAGGARSYQRRVKPLDHRDETIYAYLFDFFPDGKPPAKNGEPSELVLGCESSSQCHGRPLTEPANNNPIRGETVVDLLFDEFIHLISGPEDPRFVFWTFEIKTEDIKPKSAS
jgi:hypothetical protein